MKIKLDAQGEVSVLTVSGPVAGASLDVLKAGVLKLLDSGKSPLIVDLTQAQVAPEVSARLADLHVLIASPDPLVASGPTVEECIKILSSPAAKLLADESKLKARLASAQAEKARMLAKLDETAALAAEIKKLRRENSELQAILAVLEAQVRGRVKHRKPPFASDGIEGALGEVRDVIVKVFTPSGLLRERAG